MMIKVTWSIFKVDDDYIVAETAEQAIEHLKSITGPDYYPEGEAPEVEVIPHDRTGWFEREDGKGFDKMTFGEWLADFDYRGPQIVCWNE
jgi:hypothetical protein